jgi:hypothetical protein
MGPFVIATALMLSLHGVLATALKAQEFDCLELKCSEIRSCAEAHHKLTICGHTKRDGDNDGIPCEGLCGSDPETYTVRLKAQSPGSKPDIPPGPSIGSGYVGPARAEPNGDTDDQLFNCLRRKRTCREMTSCEEATFYLTQCKVRSLDGNNDGVACNSLCR